MKRGLCQNGNENAQYKNTVCLPASPHLSHTRWRLCASVLQGSASCDIENHGGVVTLRPLPGCVCRLNEREIAEPCRLAQGRFRKLSCVMSA